MGKVATRLLTVFSIPFFATCNLLVPVDWSDYATLNLIETTPLALTTPPTWTADWEAPYMRFERVDDPEADGVAPPPGLGRVFRLEILNLMPNGTFDADTLPWYSVVDPPSPDIISYVSDVSDGQYMRIEFSEREDRVEFPIAAALDAGLANGSETRPLYLFKTMINSVTAPFRMEYYDAQIVDGSEVTPVRWQFDTPFTDEWVLFPEDFELDAVSAPATIFSSIDPDGIFVIGTQSQFQFAQTMSLDDFRLIRPEIPLALRLAVPYEHDDRPELPRGGTYTLRIWARTDPTAGSENRIAARRLSVALTTSVGLKTFPVGSASWVVHELTDNWAEYVAMFTGLSFGPPADGTDAVLEVMITPTNAGGEYLDLDAGSLLISTPALEWAPR